MIFRELKGGRQGFTNGSDAGAGGDGGTFVVRTGNIPLIIAVGGDGATNSVGQCGTNRDGMNASITTSGTASANGLVSGGINGNGGGAISGSGGGGSYNVGANQVNVSGVQSGNGIRIINYRVSPCIVTINTITAPTSGQSNGSIDLNVSGGDNIRYCRWSTKKRLSYPTGNDFDLTNAPAGSYYLMLITKNRTICYEGPYPLGTL